MAEGTVSLLSDTVATDVKESNIRFDDEASDSGASQTSYAQTLLSRGDITIPSPPKSAKGELPFECPYCHFIIATKGTLSWNRHIFQDLQPYICIATTCATSDKLYSTRREWLHHWKRVHPTDFNPHFEKEDTAPSFLCPLCREMIMTERQYNRHVARHLQELALFILPRADNDSDTDEGGSGSDVGSSAESDASEDLEKSKDTCSIMLEGCENLLHKRYGPGFIKALHGGEVTYEYLRIGLLDIANRLLGMDLDLVDDHNLENKRAKLLNDAKTKLDALGKEIESYDRRSDGPSVSDSDEAENHNIRIDVEQKEELVFCHSCKFQWHGDQGTGMGLQCPNCSSDLVGIIDPLKEANKMPMADVYKYTSAELGAKIIEKAKDLAEEAEATRPQLTFTDAIGRKFKLPFHLCSTWSGMENLVKESFAHVEVIGPHVKQGHYDLLDSQGKVILPHVWEAVIQPDSIITMQLWPIAEERTVDILTSSVDTATSSRLEEIQHATSPDTMKLISIDESKEKDEKQANTVISDVWAATTKKKKKAAEEAHVTDSDDSGAYGWGAISTKTKKKAAEEAHASDSDEWLP